MLPCLFCGGDASDPYHLLVCDGRQGRIEALYGTQGDVPFEQASETSAQAAANLDADELSRLEAIVFGIIARQPRTCDAVETETGLAHQTVSARIRGLVLRDQLVDSGRRTSTRSGRQAVIWRVKTAADRGAA